MLLGALIRLALADEFPFCSCSFTVLFVCAVLSCHRGGQVPADSTFNLILLSFHLLKDNGQTRPKAEEFL